MSEIIRYNDIVYYPPTRDYARVISVWKDYIQAFILNANGWRYRDNGCICSYGRLQTGEWAVKKVRLTHKNCSRVLVRTQDNAFSIGLIPPRWQKSVNLWSACAMKSKILADRPHREIWRAGNADLPIITENEFYVASLRHYKGFLYDQIYSYPFGRTYFIDWKKLAITHWIDDSNEISPIESMWGNNTLLKPKPKPKSLIVIDNGLNKAITPSKPKQVLPADMTAPYEEFEVECFPMALKEDKPNNNVLSIINEDQSIKLARNLSDAAINHAGLQNRQGEPDDIFNGWNGMRR